MQIGTQIYSPYGLAELEPEVTYFFLKNDAKSGRVFVVRFFEKSYKKDARIYVINRETFEAGVENLEIKECSTQKTLPSWLDGVVGNDFTQLDIQMHRSMNNREVAEQRLGYISKALAEISTILSSTNPELSINQFARKCSPQQNETRFRTWLLTYLCFGQNIWSLSPTFFRAGHWNRLTKNKKFGVACKGKNRRTGFPMSETMAEKCIQGFQHQACFGKKMTKIYIASLVDEFGCATRRIGKKVEVYQPDGLPFPSFDQFRYRVIKIIGKDEVHRILYGEARFRRTKSVDEGSFIQNIANLMERVDADGYFSKEKPRGYLNDSVLDPLCCVTQRDFLSGMKVGIGFSMGAERNSAYKQSLFCAAVPKTFYCSLFGLQIEEEDWPSHGLPPWLTVDRGPGAAKDLIRDFENKFPIRELAPAYSGQSKSIIESSHPRSTKKEGQATFVQSDKTPIALARQEICRLIEFNRSSCVEHRLHPDPELADIQPSPLELWNHFSARGRTDGMLISIDEAVRLFLTPVELTLKSDGVWLNSALHYSSPELKKSTSFKRLAEISTGSVQIKGYVLDLAIRQLWVELDGQILMLSAKLKYRDDESLLDISLKDLAAWKERRAIANSDFREQKHDVALEMSMDFSEKTGSGYDSGKRKSGRAKANATSQLENREAREISRNRRSA